MDKSELKNVAAIAALTLVIAYFIYGYGLGPFGWKGGISGMRTETAKLVAKRQELERRVSDAKAKVSELPRIRKERETLEAQLKEISRKLPSERESAEVLRSVESLAGRSGLTLAGVKRRPVRSQELYAELPMEVGVGGGYHDLVKFADQLAALDRLVTLSELRVQRPPPPLPGQTAPAATAPPPGSSVKAELVTVVFQALPDLMEAATPQAGGPGTPVPATPTSAPAR
jgi:Tfp pilus assembly protein PilO